MKNEMDEFIQNLKALVNENKFKWTYYSFYLTPNTVPIPGISLSKYTIISRFRKLFSHTESC